MEHGKEKNSRGIKDERSGKKSGFKDACVGSKSVEKEHPARNEARVLVPLADLAN